MPNEPQKKDLPEGFLAQYESVYTGDARWKLVRHFFKVEAVRTNRDILPDALYFVYAKESHLIRSGDGPADLDPVPMTVVASGKAMKPIPRIMLVKMGKNEQLWRLSEKPRPVVEPLQTEIDTSLEDASAGSRLVRSVDISSLSNLLSAARQSGLVPALDQIAHVRDCEFREGKYDQAFDITERLFVAFRQAADQRHQKLMDEEMQYRSGILKMSPKQWQQKKQRDLAQTQIVERTRRSFIRVLDGLRGLTLPE